MARSRAGRILKAIGVFFGTLFLLAAGFLYWASKSGWATEALRDELITALRDHCGIEAQYEKISADLISREIHLERVLLETSTSTAGAPRRRLAAIEEAIVRVAFVPLLYGRLQLTEISVLRPEARLELSGGRVTNLPRCLAPKGEGTSPLVVGITSLIIERGLFVLSVAGAFEAQLNDIGVSLQAGASGGTDLDVGFDTSTVTAGAKDIPIERFRLRGHVAGPLTRPRAVSIDSLEVQAATAHLAAEGSIDLVGPVYEARVALDVPLSAATTYVEGFPEASGDAHVEAQVSGTLIDPRFVGSVRVTNGRVADLSTGDEVSVSVRADRKALDVSSFELKLADGNARGKARVLLDEHLTTEADVLVTDLPFSRVLDAVGIKGTWVSFAAGGTIAMSGTLKDPVKLGGRLDIDVDDFHVFDRGWDRPELRRRGELDPAKVLLALGPTNVRAAWAADPAGFNITGAQLSSGTTHGTADARINFESTRGLSIKAELPELDMRDLGPIAGLAFNGQGSLLAQIEGPYSDIRGQGLVDLADVAVAGIPFGDARGDAAWHDNVIKINSVTGKLGETRYSGDLEVVIAKEATLDIAGAISRGRIEDLLVPFGVNGKEWGDPKGVVTGGTFDLAGPVKRMTGSIALSAEAVEIVGEKMEHADMSGRMEAGAIVVEELELEKHGAAIEASGMIDPNGGAVRARARTRRFTLSKLDIVQASMPELDGDLDVALSLTGTLHGVTGTITADLPKLRAGPLTSPGGRIVGRVQGATVKTSGALLEGALAVDGEIRVAKGIPYKAELRANELDVPKLVGAIKNGNLMWGGLVIGKADLSGSLIDWRESEGVIAVDRAIFDTPVLHIETTAPARLTLERGVLETKRLSLAGPRTKLLAHGKLGRVLDLGIEGRVDLEIAETMLKAVSRSEGVLTVDGTVRGTPDNLDLVGTGKIERGVLELKALPHKFSNVTAQLSFSQSTVLIDRLDGRIADGRVSGSGEILLEGFKPGNIALRATLEGVRPQLTYPKFDLTGVLDGQIVLEGRPEHVTLRGELDVQRAVARPKFEWSGLVGSASARLQPNVYDPSNEVMSFDVLLHMKDPLQLRNDQATAEIGGDITLTGTNQRIGMVGAASVLRGRVSFLGREYSLDAGTIEFRDRLRFAPRYDLVLSARACEANITLNIVGTLEEFSTSYSSKPEKDETNIISCLIRGVEVKDLENLRGEALGNFAASFAGEALWRLSGVDREVKKVLPVDQIDVTTEYSSKQHAYEPRVLVAKEILEGKVRLEYSSSLLNNNDQRATVRYRITPRLTLQSGWASSDDIPIGDLGLDLKYRWEW